MLVWDLLLFIVAFPPPKEAEACDGQEHKDHHSGDDAAYGAGGEAGGRMFGDDVSMVFGAICGIGRDDRDDIFGGGRVREEGLRDGEVVALVVNC